MLAFIHAHIPVIPLIVGFCLGAVVFRAFKPAGWKKAQMAELKARVEALERKA